MTLRWLGGLACPLGAVFAFVVWSMGMRGSDLILIPASPPS